MMNVDQKARPGALVFSICLLGFSIWAFWQSYKISGFESLFGPGMFPMLASGVMLISGAFILARTVKTNAGYTSSLTAIVSFLLPLRVIVFVPMMVGFAAAMPWIGFFPSAALFIFAALAFLWRKNLFWTLGVTGVSVLSIYLIFRIVFQVVMPTGVVWM